MKEDKDLKVEFFNWCRENNKDFIDPKNMVEFFDLLTKERKVSLQDVVDKDKSLLTNKVNGVFGFTIDKKEGDVEIKSFAKSFFIEKEHITKALLVMINNLVLEDNTLDIKNLMVDSDLYSIVKIMFKTMLDTLLNIQDDDVEVSNKHTC